MRSAPITPLPRFSSVLRVHRLRRGLSQRALAGLADTAEAYIWQLEHGRREPSFELACRLADALGVDVGELRPVVRDPWT